MESDDKIDDKMTGEEDSSQLNVESVRGTNEDTEDDSESQNNLSVYSLKQRK